MRWRALAGLYSSLRRTGYTTAIAGAAKACDGVVLCRTAAQAAAIVAEHGVRVATIYEPDQLRGRNRALLPDNATVMAMLDELVRLQDRNERDEAAIAKLDRQLAEEFRVSQSLRRQLVALSIEADRGRDLLALAEGRIAFRALATIGLAIAMGMLGRLAPRDHGHGCNDLTLRRKTGYDAKGYSVYACDCGADEHNAAVHALVGEL